MDNGTIIMFSARVSNDVRPKSACSTTIENGSSIWVNQKLSVVSGSFLYCV